MNHTATVSAAAASEAAILDKSAPAGAFYFPPDHKHILCACPCGCGDVMNLPVVREHRKGMRGWGWDGSTTNPTLKPSIRQVSGCKWHGFLKVGVWRPCGDSGQ